VRELREADKHHRFTAVCPHIEGLKDGTCIDLHSKVMIVDDEWCRIGSSNLSNRSMGMDTECDLTIEAQGDAKIAAAIRQFRDDLIAEHSALPRQLLELPAPELTEAKLAMASVGDPGSPLALERIVEQVAPEVKMKKGFKVRKALYILGGVIAAAVVLALLWTRTPLADWVTRENAAQIADWFAQRWWAPVLVVLAYTPASFIMFPRWIITMTAVLAFGPWHGLVYAFAGVIIAGICTFLPGRMVSRDTIRRLAGKRLKPLTHFTERKGLVAVTILRLMPIAPFPIVNLVMGAMRVKLWHFVVGTIIGMMPGMLAATVLSEQLAAALEDPTRVNFWLVGAAVLVIFTVVFFGQRYMRRHGAAH